MHPEVLGEIRCLMAFRTRLIPYLSRLLARYRDHYEPVLRPLFYDFPDDAESWAENELFMLGDALLVAPVLSPGAECRDLRLPAGARWRDGWTGTVFEGGTRVSLAAPLDRPPFLIRLDAPSGVPEL